VAQNRPNTSSLYQRRDQPAKGTAMTAIAKAFASAIPAISPDVEILKTVAVFCGVGLFVSLILAICGLDLGVDLF
jgi:hypothetical protein